ncbi:MAG: DUF624 domain-containing protein [Defluviitaleaceae bacterium]|nr:DUF624 domain-containing protein [Defluviitaleaceae bacterium]MCL2836479.1 DUF624 domain-containing protein [Defluviitaleaceae bacterium]
MKIFDLDSPVIRFLTMMADVMIISLLWILTSIPIVTVGASTTAAYYVLTRRVSNREGYLLRDYFTAFRINFVNATLAFLTLMVFIIVPLLNIYNIEFYGRFGIVALPLNIVMIAEAIFVYIHIFPMASRFDMKYRQLLKSAFLIANKHLLTTITHAAFFVGVLLLIFYYPILLLFGAGIYCWLSSYMLMRIYRKYRPEMDKNEHELELMNKSNK